jgi:hypothetical protein
MVLHEGVLKTNRTRRSNPAGKPRLPWGDRSREPKGEKYMSRIKMILLASVAAVVLSAVGAGAASAGNGTVSLAGSQPCDVTFNSTGTPPSSSTTISSVVASPTDPDCAVTIKPSTIIDVDFDGAGNLEANGAVEVVAFGFVNCNYAVNAVAGTYSGGTATIAGSLSTGSGFPCPNPAAGTINVAAW